MRKSLDSAPRTTGGQSVTKTAAINGAQGQGRAQRGKGERTGGDTVTQPAGTCQPVRQLPGCSKSTFASVDWRHIFGRDNAAQLIFLSPVSISRN